MSKSTHAQTKLKALSTAGIKALITDILIEHDKQADNYEQEAGPIGYARYCSRLLREMKQKYEREMKKDKLISRQTDLEDLIAICKEEEAKKKVQ